MAGACSCLEGVTVLRAQKFISLLFHMHTYIIGVGVAIETTITQINSLTAVAVKINGFGNWGTLRISREPG